MKKEFYIQPEIATGITLQNTGVLCSSFDTSIEKMTENETYVWEF